MRDRFVSGQAWFVSGFTFGFGVRLADFQAALVLAVVTYAEARKARII